MQTMDRSGMNMSAVSYAAVFGHMMTFLSTVVTIDVDWNKETLQWHFRIVIYPGVTVINFVMSSATVVLTSMHCKFRFVMYCVLNIGYTQATR